MATGGYRFEVEPQRDMAGAGPVVRYEVQEGRAGLEDGERCWKVWMDSDDKDRAIESYRIVRGFTPADISLRLAKITTEVMEVDG